MDIRKDVINIPIQNNAYFLVYHKIVNIGFGPTLILCINNKEIIKFDYFGKEKGHFHIMNGERIFLTETTVELQIDKSIKELTDNIDFYIKSIKNFKLDKNIFISKCKDVHILLNEYENKFYKNLRNNID